MTTRYERPMLRAGALDAAAKLIVLGMCCGLIEWATASAASPASVLLGKQLFEKEWLPTNPRLGSDGLGPLFNGQSCVACHHQGGVGGAGDARFNAKTLGIEALEVRATHPSAGFSPDDVARIVASFHPGFISQGTILNTAVIAHQGGSTKYDRYRRSFLDQLPAEFSEEGGPSDATEVRRANASPIVHVSSHGPFRMSVRARIFQRNTTALFGAGLIDRVTKKQIDQVAHLQRGHAEISGRPSTLKDGRYGRFGWRANVATLADFCDQACANEVGLETDRKPQAVDPTTPGYRNPKVDISDREINAMADFVAALPAPQRSTAQSPDNRARVQRGQQLFASVGCAVCHRPDMGPATGIYSDLLLHDMGPELADLNHAEPYRVRFDLVSSNDTYTRDVDRRQIRAEDPRLGRSAADSYYGGSTRAISSSNSNQIFTFDSPTRPYSSIEYLPGSFAVPRPMPGETKDDGSKTARNRRSKTEAFSVRTKIERTNFNQEWRTAPLWGLRDSAPYMHDGRAGTVLEAIAMHGGEAAGSSDRFLNLPYQDRSAVLAFLDSFVAPKHVAQPSPDQVAAD